MTTATTEDAKKEVEFEKIAINGHDEAEKLRILKYGTSNQQKLINPSFYDESRLSALKRYCLY
jgi:hypothetical protein